MFFFGGCGIYVGIMLDVGHLKISCNISIPSRGSRKLVLGIWFGGVDRICLFKVAHSQNAYPVEKQSQAAVGSVFTIPWKYFIYLVWNNILFIFLILSIFCVFDFCVFSIFLLTSVQNWLYKHDFNRDEKRVKIGGFENIPTIFILKIKIEHVRYSIYSRMTIYIIYII